jgi:signal transduction histidine kinase
MFSGLRLRLTLLYAAAALTLILLVAGGTLLLLARYFQGVTDLALQHKMTHEFHRLGAPIPPGLASADSDWSILRGEVSLLGRSRPSGEIISADQALRIALAVRGGGQATKVELGDEEGRRVYEIHFADGGETYVDALSGRILKSSGGERDAERPGETPAGAVAGDQIGSGAYDAELAAIYVLPLDRQGRVLFDPNVYAPPADADTDALAAALARGSDVRTITTPGGEQVRLLTYQLTRDDGPAALQLGRVLTDQRRVLDELFLGVLLLSGASGVLLGLGSWWLAGRALQPAQLAWERQQSFIANASHELRTPLTLMRASAEVAQRALPSAETDQRALLGDIVVEADHMRTLVDDLLLLSRLDSGRLQLARAPIALDELLADTRRQAGRLAETRDVAISLGAVEGMALADRDRLRQVLLILLDNALRHTPPGGRVTLSAVSRRRGMVQITVADTGAGIAPEHLAHVFERFYRADPARGGGNAGLGLSIARSLVAAMGGQIEIESAVGRGTSVSLSLPAA